MILFLGCTNTGTGASRLGEFRIWDSKIWAWVTGDSDPRWLRWQGLAAIVSDRPVLSSERGRPTSTYPLLSDNNKSLIVENVSIFRAMGRMRDNHQSVTTWAEEDIVGIRHQATAREDLYPVFNSITEPCPVAVRQTKVADVLHTFRRPGCELIPTCIIASELTVI
jgi:hypothetical protein